MSSNTLLYVTSHWHNESNRIFLAFASIRSKFTIFDSLRSIYMRLRYEMNFLRESSNLSSPRFVNIREPCLFQGGSHLIYLPLMLKTNSMQSKRSWIIEKWGDHVSSWCTRKATQIRRILGSRRERSMQKWCKFILRDWRRKGVKIGHIK